MTSAVRSLRWMRPAAVACALALGRVAAAEEGTVPPGEVGAGAVTDAPQPRQLDPDGDLGRSPPQTPRAEHVAAPSMRAQTDRRAETSQAIRITLGLTLLAVLPALIVSVTPFLRSIIVLSMLRHGLGMNQTPPNTVLIGLSLFITLFTMSPVLERIQRTAVEPFMAGKLSMEAAYGEGIGPLREFMVRQTREQDLALLIELSKAPPPRTIQDVSNVQLVPAYMLSELRAAFQIGFVVLLPFLLIDLVVSSILMALGMMMMPPAAISLPLKVMMFLLVDGWVLLVKALVGSIH